jgi:hypothetical protein
VTRHGKPALAVRQSDARPPDWADVVTLDETLNRYHRLIGQVPPVDERPSPSSSCITGPGMLERHR